MAKEKLFDIERIKALVSVEMVCDKLGLETKPIGRRISVLCPFHGDTHFGNAYIFKDNLYCYACNTNADVIGIVQKVYNLTFVEAVEFLIREFNLHGCFMEQDRMEQFPFSKKELTLIGLLNENNHKKEKYIISYADKKEDKDSYVMRSGEDSVLVKKGKSMMYHNYTLYDEDKKLFLTLAANKALEKKAKLSSTIKQTLTYYLERIPLEDKFKENILAVDICGNIICKCAAQLKSVESVLGKCRYYLG